MALWNYSGNKNENKEPERDKNKSELSSVNVKISQQSKRKFEDICIQNGIRYTVNSTPDGAYEFSFEEKYLPLIKNFFALSTRDEQAKRDDEHVRKPSLNDTIGGAAGRTGDQNNADQRANQTVKTRESQAIFSPEHAQNPPKIPSQQPQTTHPTQPKKQPKDLTTDFGILTIEEQKRLDERQSRTESEKKQRKKRVKTGRDTQVKTRLTDTEMELFSERVKASGMKQGDFMRECLLHETVNVRSLTEIDAQAFGKLMEISSDLGRIGGLIKGTVVANRDSFSVLSDDDKKQLEIEIRELNKIKDEVMKVVQSLYGNS